MKQHLDEHNSFVPLEFHLEALRYARTFFEPGPGVQLFICPALVSFSRFRTLDLIKLIEVSLQGYASLGELIWVNSTPEYLASLAEVGNQINAINRLPETRARRLRWIDSLIYTIDKAIDEDRRVAYHQEIPE